MKKLIFKSSFVVVAMALTMVILANSAEAGSTRGCQTYRVYNRVGYSYDYCLPSYTQTPVIQAPVYQQPVYQPVYQAPVYQAPVYPALSASCYTNNPGSVVSGTSVQWYATAYGGNGSYAYSWTGTDGLTGSGQMAYVTYYNTGDKTAMVTVYSAGQSVSVNCSNSATVYSNTYYNYQYQQPNYNYNNNYNNGLLYTNNSGLDVACFSDPVVVVPNQATTWKVEVTGGVAPYTYTWTGTDNLSGNEANITKYYSTGGTKSAVVSVQSADGKSETRACSTSVAVRSGGSNLTQNNTTRVVSSSQTNSSNTSNSQSNLGAASLFSLSNIPWGWVALLVILVLFATVMYLLFNRPKI